jgi:uncharacterized protein (DUF488 family)
MSHRLFTIGYEGKDLSTVLHCLKAAGVECVLDVRENPFSRKPGFSKGPLSKAMETAGIRYVHLKELGTPRALREKVKLDGDYGQFFSEMRQYLAMQEEAIERACRHVRCMICCLICYEESVDTCHRKVVAEMIRERFGDGLDVVHLRAE